MASLYAWIIVSVAIIVIGMTLARMEDGRAATAPEVGRTQVAGLAR
jgi:hypothetical protein